MQVPREPPTIISHPPLPTRLLTRKVAADVSIGGRPPTAPCVLLAPALQLAPHAVPRSRQRRAEVGTNA